VRPARWELAENGGRVGARKAGSDQLLHGALGLAAGRIQERGVILLGQVFPQEDQRGQVNGAAFDPLENDRKPPRQASRGDAAKGFSLTHPEPPHAILEHRRTGGTPMKPPILDLYQALQQARREPALSP